MIDDVKSTSIFYKKVNPLFLGGVFILTNLACIFFLKLLDLSTLFDIEYDVYWKSSCTIIFVYVAAVCIFALSSQNINQFIAKSIVMYIILIASAYFLVTLLRNDADFTEVDSFKWILYVISFGYLVFLSIIGFVRKIVDYAENETWTAPKRKNKS
ncbi:MAG: hypothetical protein KBA06_03885 [Saprospiraceae bacterium]|nr:hypothetical protein [Saprospiraceae bacterium]